MSTNIVDKRLLPKNATVGSRQKFIDRYKDAIKKRIRAIVAKGNLTDTLKGDKKIKIKADDLAEPQFDFEHGTGKTDRIYIGNKSFKKGQLVRRPSKGKGPGSGASNSGKGEDEFEFMLTEKEFSDLFFEDLALPDMIKRQFIGKSFEIQHAGLSRSGGPTSLNVKRTMLNSIGRRTALKIRDLVRALVQDKEDEKKKPLELEEFKKKHQFIEDIDLRYNFKDKVDVPTTKCVMFALMDVSGSMGEREKDIAKRFFILLNMFLRRNYDEVDIVFVRHTEMAEEVNEETFFYDRKSGGTVISSGYEKIDEIISQRYDLNQYNIYVAQASDGENWAEDMPHMEEVLVQKVLPKVQYFAYIDIQNSFGQFRGGQSDMMVVMKRMMGGNGNLQAREVASVADIWQVFRSLFLKKEKV